MKITKGVGIIIHTKKADNFCDPFIVEVISYDIYSSLGCPGENFIPWGYYIIICGEVQGKIHLHSRYKAKNLDKGHLLS